ncbi:MAG: hypothetical protein ACFFAS_08000 [Promethearchaeota archaeon]
MAMNLGFLKLLFLRLLKIVRKPNTIKINPKTYFTQMKKADINVLKMMLKASNPSISSPKGLFELRKEYIIIIVVKNYKKSTEEEL